MYYRNCNQFFNSDAFDHQGHSKSFKSLDLAMRWTLSSSHSHHNALAASNRFDDIKTSVDSQMRFNDQTSSYEWITDLSLMEPYWNDWFVGLTRNFLNFRVHDF